MKILPEQAEYICGVVRDTLAIDPMISIRRLQRTMEPHLGRTISDKYLMRLLAKMRRQVVIQADRKQLKTRFMEVSERYRVLNRELYRIIWWTQEYFIKFGIARPTNKEKISAIKAAAQMDIALLETEMDIGLFEDQRVALEEMLREGLLPTELHEQIIGVVRSWRFGRSAVRANEEQKPRAGTDSQRQLKN